MVAISLNLLYNRGMEGDEDMNESALRRRLFLGIVCVLFLTAYFILGTQHRTLSTTMPAVVFSRTDHSQHWTGTLSLHGSATFGLLRPDRSFSGTISIPGYPETWEEGFQGTMYLYNPTNQGIYFGVLLYDRETTGDAFFLGKVHTTRRLDAFSMSLTAPGVRQPIDAGDGAALDYILIAPCSSLADAVSWAESQGLLDEP